MTEPGYAPQGRARSAESLGPQDPRWGRNVRFLSTTQQHGPSIEVNQDGRLQVAVAEDGALDNDDKLTIRLRAPLAVSNGELSIQIDFGSLQASLSGTLSALTLSSAPTQDEINAAVQSLALVMADILRRSHNG